MDYHHHARLAIRSRELLAERVLEGRLSLKETAAEFKLNRQSAAKWVARFRAQWAAGSPDRSSRPRSCPRRTSPELVEHVVRLRRERWAGVRIAFSAIYHDGKEHSVIAFLDDALAHYNRLGICFRAILTDNGPAYHSRGLAARCRALGLKHRFTRLYTPRTNGNAERFI